MGAKGKSKKSQGAKAKASKSKKAEEKARRAVIDTALIVSLSGLSPGRSGNVSCRWNDGMLITPTGMSYEDIRPRDIVFVDSMGRVPGKKSRKPSSEWRFHLAAYHARNDISAVVHAHSMHATVLACAHEKIPAFHYMVAIAGGRDIPLVPYATFGTEELAKEVGKAIRKRDACLMANHGQLAVGKSLDEALELANEIEVLATQYCKVLELGEPHIIPHVEMKRVLQRFKSYGQRSQHD